VASRSVVTTVCYQPILRALAVKSTRPFPIWNRRISRSGSTASITGGDARYSQHALCGLASNGGNQCAWSTSNAAIGPRTNFPQASRLRRRWLVAGSLRIAMNGMHINLTSTKSLLILVLLTTGRTAAAQGQPDAAGAPQCGLVLPRRDVKPHRRHDRRTTSSNHPFPSNLA
jgi:hypothetical protein